jgi:TP901 family phage tail tape measure protein
LLARAISEVVKVNAEFELTMNKVRAITGASQQEFDRLTKSAKELALGTMFTANEVGELQLAYSKLGFTVVEIEKAAEATLKLATITGDDLGGAADVVGATIRGFGLDASEATKVVDVMAKSFTSSALSLENFKQSMKTVAPIAASANIDLETTTAMLGKLADSGLRGTRAATGLKNIFMALTDETSELAQFLGYTVNNSEGAMMALKDLGEEGLNLAVAQGLISKRAAAAFLVLSDGVKDVESLRGSLKRARGTADEMAGTIEQSLTVKFNKFKSAVEGFTLREGQGLINMLGTALDALSEFINETDRGYRVMQKFKKEQEEVAGGLSTALTPTKELTEALKKKRKVVKNLMN